MLWSSLVVRTEKISFRCSFVISPPSFSSGRATFSAFVDLYVSRVCLPFIPLLIPSCLVRPRHVVSGTLPGAYRYSDLACLTAQRERSSPTFMGFCLISAMMDGSEFPPSELLSSFVELLPAYETSILSLPQLTTKRNAISGTGSSIKLGISGRARSSNPTSVVDCFLGVYLD